MLLISCHFEPSINELGVDFSVSIQDQFIHLDQQNQNDNSLFKSPSHMNASSSSTRLRSPYLLNPQTSPIIQLAQAAVAEAERTGSSQAVATVSNMPTSNLYKLDNQHLNLDPLSSENERSDQTNPLITSTESDSQDEEFVSRLQSKRGISLLDELIMANNTAAEYLVNQLCALDSEDSDILDSSEDDLLLLDGLKIRDLEQLLQMVSIEHLDDNQLITAAAVEEALSQHAKRKALTRYLRKRRQMKSQLPIGSSTSALDWDQLSALSNTLTKHEFQIQNLQQQAQLPSILFNQGNQLNSTAAALLSKSLSPQPCTYIQQTNLINQRSGSVTPKLTYYGDIYTSSGTTSSAVAAHLASLGVSAVPLNSNQINQLTNANQQQQLQKQQQQQQQRKLPQMPKSACLPVPSSNINTNLSSPGTQLTVLNHKFDSAISPTRNQQFITSPKRYPPNSNLEPKSTYQQYDNDYEDDEQMMLEDDDELILNDEFESDDWQKQKNKRSLNSKEAMISYGNRRLPQIGPTKQNDQYNAPRPHRKLPHIIDT